jgi:hypothetical protein
LHIFVTNQQQQKNVLCEGMGRVISERNRENDVCVWCKAFPCIRINFTTLRYEFSSLKSLKSSFLFLWSLKNISFNFRIWDYDMRCPSSHLSFLLNSGQNRFYFFISFYILSLIHDHLFFADYFSIFELKITHFHRILCVSRFNGYKNIYMMTFFKRILWKWKKLNFINLLAVFITTSWSKIREIFSEKF